MRRLALILLVAVAVVPTAALAGRLDSGAGVFELRGVDGTVTLTATGVLWGQIDKGSIRIASVDTSDAATPLVSGAEHVSSDGDATVYSGIDLHFRITGGRYHLRLKGNGLDLTAIGVGNADMVGDPTASSTGSYAIDSGTWTPVPLLETTVPYGTANPTTTTTPSQP